MSQQTAEAIVDEITELGTIPEVTFHILRMLDDPSTSVSELNEVLESDQSLSSRLLKLSNSAFFGFSRQVTTVERAVVLLGFNAVKALSVSASMSTLFAGDMGMGDFTPAQLGVHAVAVGASARRIATHQKLDKAEDAFMAGILHDMGLLMESQYRPLEFAEAIDAHAGGTPILEAEAKALDTTHCEVAGCVAERWSFPESLVDVLTCHHEPESARDACADLPRLVYVADQVCGELDFGYADTTTDPELATKMGDWFGLETDAMDGILEGLGEEVATMQQILTGQADEMPTSRTG